MESMLWLGIALIFAGVLLIIIEAFVPSGGLLSVLAMGCSVAGVICMFRYDTMWGLVGLLCSLLATPMAFAFALKVWPHTTIGKKMLGAPSEEEVQAAQLEEQRERDRQFAMIGMQGAAVTDLRPVGIVEIGQDRYEAIAETGMIVSGTQVRVTLVENSRIKVRPVG